jgi:hypothetical protein
MGYCLNYVKSNYKNEEYNMKWLQVLTNQRGEAEGLGLFGLIGIVWAAVISWDRNHSILWAIFHGWCNWFYIVYT